MTVPTRVWALGRDSPWKAKNGEEVMAANRQMLRRQFIRTITCVAASVQLSRSQSHATGDVVIERPVEGRPHVGKVLLAIQAHSDDIPLHAAGTVAKLVKEGYKGYLLRATNDDMGDAPGLGTAGTIGENVLGNERDTAQLVNILGLERAFDFNYNNHYMAGVSQNEVMARVIFLIRLLKVDTVICWDPWAHYEENPDHYVIARATEAACWIAGRAHDYPEHLAAGLEPHTVSERYYFARHPEINRIVDISDVVDKKVDANRANVAKGPGGRHGSMLRAELAEKKLHLPLLGDDNLTADRAYIKEFVLRRNRELGQKHGLKYAEAFHYIGGRNRSRVDEYVNEKAVPLSR